MPKYFLFKSFSLLIGPFKNLSVFLDLRISKPTSKQLKIYSLSYLD